MSIKIIDQLSPLGNFPVVNASDVQVGNERLSTVISNKVDKSEGKGLSSNDYTTEEKHKLSGIEPNANNYVHPTAAGSRHIPAGGAEGKILGWEADGTAQWIDNESTQYPDATTSTHGLMSAADKAKLDEIEAQANKTVVDAALNDSSINPVQNKIINSAIQAISTFVTPQMFGAKADGSTDDSDAIQAAVDHGGIIIFPQGVYKITQTIVIPCTSHLFANGLVRLNCLVEGFALHFKGEVRGTNDNYTEMSYPIIGGYSGYFYIYNSQVDIGNITGYHGIKIGDPSDDQQHFGRARIENVRLWYFDIACAVTGHNFYLADFDHYHAEFCNMGLVFNFSSGTDNSGENVNLNRCIFGNTKNAIYFNNAGTYTLQIVNSSFDYNGKCFSGTIDKRSIYLDHCHIEQNTHQKFYPSGTEDGGIITGNFAAGYMSIRNTVFVCHTNEFIKKFYVWGNLNNIEFDNISCYYSAITLNAQKGFFLANQYVKIKNMGIRNDRFIMTSRDNNILYNGDLSGGSTSEIWGYGISSSTNVTTSISNGTNVFTDNAHEIIGTCNEAGNGYISVSRYGIAVNPRRLYAVTFVGLCSKSVSSKNIKYQVFDSNGTEILSGQGLANDGVTDFRQLVNPNTACIFRTPNTAATLKLTFEMSAESLAIGESFKLEYVHLEDITNSDDSPKDAIS